MTRTALAEDEGPEGQTPCLTCGHLTVFAKVRKCHTCWTVESLLPDYLRSENGRAFVVDLLGESPR